MVVVTLQLQLTGAYSSLAAPYHQVSIMTTEESGLAVSDIILNVSSCVWMSVHVSSSASVRGL